MGLKTNQTENVLNSSAKYNKTKTSDVVLISLIIGLAIIQFTSPIAEINGNKITSFEGLKYGDLHWSFYYFYFMSSVVLLGIILFFKKCLSKSYDLLLWALAFIGILVFMIGMQGFSAANSAGIKDDSTNGVFSFFIVIVCCFIIIGKLFNQHQRSAKEIKEKMLTSDFKSAIKGKKILYENDILLNPPWNFTLITHPDPLKMAVTDKEIVISSSPLTRIPLSKIESVGLNMFIATTLFAFIPVKIKCNDGSKYGLVYCPANKMAPFSLLENKEISHKLNQILKKVNN